MAQEKLSFSKAMAEIEDIVSKIESNKYELDELTERVKRVAYLATYCKEKLRKTDEEVQQVLDGMEK